MGAHAGFREGRGEALRVWARALVPRTLCALCAPRAHARPPATPAACTPTPPLPPQVAYAPCDAPSASIPPPPEPPASDAAAAPAPVLCALRARVELVAPRNLTAPHGRSHHTAAYHAPSRSILVFGGYTSGGGHLAELWLFSMDAMQWSQPDATGARVMVMMMVMLMMCRGPPRSIDLAPS